MGSGLLYCRGSRRVFGCNWHGAAMVRARSPAIKIHCCIGQHSALRGVPCHRLAQVYSRACPSSLVGWQPHGRSSHSKELELVGAPWREHLSFQSFTHKELNAANPRGKATPPSSASGENLALATSSGNQGSCRETTELQKLGGSRRVLLQATQSMSLVTWHR